MDRNDKTESRRLLSTTVGTVETVERRESRQKMRLITYDESQFEERGVTDVEDCFPLRSPPTVTWIDITGPPEQEMIRAIEKHFGVHPVVLEDITNPDHRPKVEDLETYIYVILKELSYVRTSKEVVAEQISLILGKDFLISFREREGKVFDAVRDGIRSGKGRARRLGPDYLAYSLIDVIVDGYFSVLEEVGEETEELEEDLVTNPRRDTLHMLHGLRTSMIILRKSVWPLREVANNLHRAESPLIKKATRIYLRDVYDYTVQVIDNIETSRDMLSGMVDIYLSSMSNRMNEIMKVLTIIATIFIPLTFIASIYGMNFVDMPVVTWRWGYPFILAVMLGIALIMVHYFRRKKWM